MKKGAVPAIFAGVVLLTSAFIAEAQQVGKIPRIGCLIATSAAVSVGRMEAFRQGLRDGMRRAKTLSSSIATPMEI
jgi:hypothetical protein